MTWQLKVMRIYVLQGSQEPTHFIWQGHLIPQHIEHNRLTAISLNNTLDGNTEVVIKDGVKEETVKEETPKQDDGKQDATKQDAAKQDDLLLKEMEESNSWMRLAFQLYFGWFALQFTINAIAMSWLFNYKGSMPMFAGWVFFVFIVWNLMGTIGTLLVHKGLLDCDQRIREVIERLAQQVVNEDPASKPRSSTPRQSINAVFVLCAITMFMSLAFWTILSAELNR
ncbi:MAG: hypothetical protein QOC99_274 [Acidobacteriota bacterium]|jgi:hypothetical protein|nr:hypothetical protein [Acidobacteriota bacterium]MDT7777762.1 hypothetical protein [Acidobacteriota bacterium]